jgi:RNA polymerase sigma-70 factor (ECF subfamily)
MTAFRQSTNQAQSGNERNNEDPDCLLVTRAQAGDLNSFERLVFQHKDQIFRTIFRITKNNEDAEDQVQETFLRAYRALCDFRGQSKFTTWLTRIAINQALACRRKRRYHEISLDHPVESESGYLNRDIQEWRPNPEQSCAQMEANVDLHEKLIVLPPGLRSALILQHFYGHSMEDVAAELGISIGAVKSRVLRARRHLRNQLGNRPDLFLPEPTNKGFEYAMDV